MRVKKFKLGSHNITVKYLKTVRDPMTGSEIMGLCDPMTNNILIATQYNGVKLAEDVLFHSLCHEVSHNIMILMGEPDLNNNEKFIDLMGGFIAQFVKSGILKV